MEFREEKALSELLVRQILDELRELNDSWEEEEGLADFYSSSESLSIAVDRREDISCLIEKYESELEDECL